MTRSVSATGGQPTQPEPFGGLFDGFEAYRTPTDADYTELFSSGLIVPDTNVFLNLYRYNEETRDDLLSLLRRLESRLWVPHQVIGEFWRNRENVLQDARNTEKTVSELNEQQNKATATLRGWANRVGLSQERKSELAEIVTSTYNRVIGEVVRLADNDAAHFARDTNLDPLIAELNRILNGRVGVALNKDDYDKALIEAERRTKEKIPPGYKDAGKSGENSAGDYLIWLQVINEVKRSPRDILIVTGDAKDDWWRRENGELRGPRPELTDEIRHMAGVRLFMLRPESLLLLARRHLNISISDKSVEDIERVDKYLESKNAQSIPIELIKTSWPEVLERVKRKRRVAWMLLSNAQPIMVTGNVLTLEFPRTGDVKGFGVSGYDALLSGVLNELFGTELVVSSIASIQDGDGPREIQVQKSIGEAPSKHSDEPPF